MNNVEGLHYAFFFSLLYENPANPWENKTMLVYQTDNICQSTQTTSNNYNNTAYTVDPWTTWGLGAQTLHQLKIHI